MKKVVFFILFVAVTTTVAASHCDTTPFPETDTTAHALRPHPASRAGNAWHLSAAYHLARHSAFDFGLGRSRITRAGDGSWGYVYRMRSWGGGYGFLLYPQRPVSHYATLYAERSFFWRPLLSNTLRAEYLHDFTGGGHYLRPSAGLNFLFFDLLYSYSFEISGRKNQFGHALTLRIKLFYAASQRRVFPEF